MSKAQRSPRSLRLLSIHLSSLSFPTPAQALRVLLVHCAGISFDVTLARSRCALGGAVLHISGLENQRRCCCTSARCVARSRCALVGAVLHICTGSADERSRRLRSLRRSPGPALDAECAAGFLERRACDPQLAPRRSLRKAHRKQGLPLSVC